MRDVSSRSSWLYMFVKCKMFINKCSYPYCISCCRLMVNLTQPAVLCFENKIPDDKTGQHYYLDLVTQLQSYKEV